jgi:hypothetical protein
MRVKDSFFLYDLMETIEAIFCFIGILLLMFIFSPMLIWDAVKERSKNKKK